MRKERKMKVKRKGLLLTVTIAGITLLFAGTGWADIPAPPVNQQVGIDDGVFNELFEFMSIRLGMR
jgi:hypothetical protein